MKLADSEIRATWETLIAKVEKYYPQTKNENSTFWYFVVSKHKNWMFDVLNKVWCNMDDNYDWHDISHPLFKPVCNHRDGYTDLEQNKTYMITTHRWSNGNTIVTIKIEDYGTNPAGATRP